MSVQTISAQAVKEAAASLRSSMSGSVHQPGEAEYADCLQIFARCDTKPALVARCASTSDVQHCVRTARQHGLPLSVRGGGHDWGGRALCSGLVLDLRSLNACTVDEEHSTVTFGGGALMSDVADAVAAVGMAVVVGATGKVGACGWMLAGGLGPLNPSYGLGADNLVSAEVVLGDGSVVTASAEQQADLFWALRGGGGAFGVVTSATWRAHALPQVLAGLVMFPLAETAAVLHGLQQLIDDADDSLGLVAGIVRSPGGPVCFIAPQLIGDAAAGERLLARIHAFGHPVKSDVRVQPWRDTLNAYDRFIVDGRLHHQDGRSLPRFTPAAIQAIVDAAAELPQFGFIALHELHGTACRVASGATAFPNREPHVLVQIMTGWSSEDDAAQRESNTRWVDSLAEKLSAEAIDHWLELLDWQQQAGQAAGS